MAITTDRVTFPGSRDAELAARFDRPAGEMKAVALFAHCFTCSKDQFAAQRIARALADLGVAVLRFDFTGLGASGGDFANTNFSSNVEDLVAAADWLRRTHRAPDLLIGHSLGGAAVLAARARIPEVAAIATIGAPAEPSHVRRMLREAEPEIAAKGEAEVELGGRRFRVRRQFLEDLDGQSLEGRIRALKAALLVMHAPLDDTVGIENATRIFVAARHPKSFLSLDDADHLLSRRADAAYAARVLAAWASRYVPGLDVETAATPAPAAGEEGVVTVAETGGGRYQNRVTSGAHSLLADEPEAVGGNGSGPGPYDLLAAALGACTSMTLRMYAERKGWAMAPVSVRLTHEKIHASQCAECETREGKIDRIERVITLDPALDAEQRQRLLEIADKCPVHRTLHSENQIITRLAE